MRLGSATRITPPRTSKNCRRPNSSSPTRQRMLATLESASRRAGRRRRLSRPGAFLERRCQRRLQRHGRRQCARHTPQARRFRAHRRRLTLRITKAACCPTFVSVDDDPTLKTFDGKTLVGNYDADDEGVRAQPVDVSRTAARRIISLGREPIRDFPESNGHGRAAAGPVAPCRKSAI